MAAPFAPPVLVLGHSYIRRLEDFTYESKQSDVTPNFDMHERQVEVDFYGIGGSTVPGITQYLHGIAGNKRYVGAMLQLGGNDLRRYSDHKQIASSLVTIGKYLQSAYGIPKVAICQLLRRTRVRYPEYNVQVGQVNDAIEEKVKDCVGLSLWKHRGFWNSVVNLQDEDGVHLNGYGLYKYYKSIKGALLQVLY